MATIDLRRHGSEGSPAVVLVHDTGGVPADWSEVAARLAEALGDRLVRTPVVLPRFGFGALPDLATLAGLADANAPLHLAGEGMGARVALELALVEPARIASLTLVNPDPGQGPAPDAVYAAAALAACPVLILVGEWADRAVRSLAASLAHAMADARFVLVDGGAAGLARSHPRTLSDALARHVSRAESRPARARRRLAA